MSHEPLPRRYFLTEKGGSIGHAGDGRVAEAAPECVRPSLLTYSRRDSQRTSFQSVRLRWFRPQQQIDCRFMLLDRVAALERELGARFGRKKVNMRRPRRSPAAAYLRQYSQLPLLTLHLRADAGVNKKASVHPSIRPSARPSVHRIPFQT